MELRVERAGNSFPLNGLLLLQLTAVDCWGVTM